MAIEIPKEVKQAPNDYVKYSVCEGKDGKFEDKDGVCYGDIMSSLQSVSIRCVPAVRTPPKEYDSSARKFIEPTEKEIADWAEPTGIDSERYFKWMQLCKDNQLVPTDARPYADDGKNYLEIPGGIYDRHLVYAALCCYRWSDSYANMVWQIVEHMEKLDGITFWQAFHHGLATRYKYGTGHSFSAIYVGSSGAYGNKENYDLSHSLAMPFFFSKTVEERKKSSDGYAYDEMAKIAQTLGGLVSNQPILYSAKLDDLLTPKWTALYQKENPTKETLLALYKEAL